MFQRRRFKQTKSLKQRLIDQVKQLREEAKLRGPGAEREVLLRKARQAETAARIDEWLSSRVEAAGLVGMTYQYLIVAAWAAVTMLLMYIFLHVVLS